MFFNKDTPLQQINNWVYNQLRFMLPIAHTGIDIEIKIHKKQRTNEQNKFLMVIMQKIVQFYHETGFLPQGCQNWMMRTDIQKEYWKARFGIESTAKLNTKTFAEFIDGIQRELIEETNGEWEIIETDSAYIKSLMGE